MLRDQKILVTGAAGQIALPIVRHLAHDNEVWGAARFRETGSRERVEAAGAMTHPIDLAAGDYEGLPDDFDYVLHLAAMHSPTDDYDAALRVNAEGTGLLLNHVRKARAVLVMSSFVIYSRNEDPFHAFSETDPLGYALQASHSPTYTASKLGQESVARTMARILELPVVIARMNVAYGANGGLPAYHLDWMMQGQPLALQAPGPMPTCPIHEDDINSQISPILAAASVPATIVNWAGDEIVSHEQWCSYLSELAGVEPVYESIDRPGTARGRVSDNRRRLELIGPCQVSWRDGMRKMWEERYPNGVRTADTGGAERLRASVDRDGQ